MVAFASESGADTGPWWLSNLITFLGIVVASRMIVYQLARQHKDESARLNENFRGQLRLQIYQEFSERLSTASNTISKAGLYAVTCHTHSVIYRQQAAQGIHPQPITDRALELLEKNGSAANEAIEVVFLIEKYCIIHPDLNIFRTAIGSAVHNLNCTFDALFKFMLMHFPADCLSPTGTVVENVKTLSDSELEELNELARSYQEAAMDLDCYLMDMRAELQTLLLGSLFPNAIARRRPADPSKKVITLDPASVKNLRQHFLKNTEWGRKAVESQLEVHREYHG